MFQVLRVPYFDNLEIECDTDLPTEVTDPVEKAVWASFLAKTEKDRLSDSRHLFAYYKDFHDAAGGEDWLDEAMGVPSQPEEIWKYVRPKMIWVDQSPKDKLWYVEIEADCDWDTEHGVHMSWESGVVLCKAGGYDGHPTNYFNPRTPETDRVVYSGSSARFTTYRE